MLDRLAHGVEESTLSWAERRTRRSWAKFVSMKKMGRAGSCPEATPPAGIENDLECGRGKLSQGLRSLYAHWRSASTQRRRDHAPDVEARIAPAVVAPIVPRDASQHGIIGIVVQDLCGDTPAQPRARL
jgi:hypothetical protein